MRSQTATPAPRPTAAPFGTVFGETMPVARWEGGTWSPMSLDAVEPIPMHPASHVLHYGSACFEGLKAHRGVDDTVRIFRLDRHVERMRLSAGALQLPVPSTALLTEMIVAVVRENLAQVPDSPGSLYLRPTLVGTAPNIGAAGSPTTEAILFVLASPVGDYFAGGLRPLRIAVETDRPRTTPQFGSVKTGANYAMALGITMEARSAHDVAQVLFMPGGMMQETGASNVLLIDGTTIVTPSFDGSFLDGVTRASVLTLASDLRMTVEERPVSLPDLIAWADHGEVALAGTAAVLSPVGTLVVDGAEVVVGDGGVGATTMSLRTALVDTQTGRLADPHGWTHAVQPSSGSRAARV